MNEFLKKIKPTYIFNIIAVAILIGFFIIYGLFEHTKNNIENINKTSHIEYISNITDNMSSLIKTLIKKDDIYNSLKVDKNLRKRLEKKLEFFITERYRYIYVVDKEKQDSKSFRFLLDGSKNYAEKSEFEESFVPLDIDVWNNIYKTKKTVFYQHKDVETVWMTYLKPIIINDEVQAIIVIDFSLKEHNLILLSLEELDKAFEIGLSFAILIFLTIIAFSYIDAKREKSKTRLYNKLEETNRVLNEKTKELNEQTSRILEFNKTLEQRVKEEVDKNRQKDKQMIQQSRLAQMGEMISMIAHQWRQPLTAISSTSSGINLKAKLETLDKETAINLTDKISEYAQHLSSTIDDFREFFKSNKSKTKTTYKELVDSALSIIGVSVSNRNIQIIKDLQCDSVFNTYPNELKQVILNLIKNAEDALVENKIEKPYIKIKTYTKDFKVILEISDNGGGIPEDIMNKIFDPYFSTKTKKDGTGLGLYMSKTIIEEHCWGKLKVKNNEQGAVFRIILNDND